MKNNYKGTIMEMEKKMQDTFRAINPLLEIQEAMERAYKSPILEMEKKMQDTFRAITPVLEIQKAMERAYKSPILEMEKKMQDTFRAITPVLEIQKAMEFSLFNQLNQLQKNHISMANIVGNVSSISEFLQQLPEEEIVANRYQTITCGPEVLNINELQDMVLQILNNIGLQEKYNIIDGYFNQVLIEIRKLKKPFLEKIIAWLIMPLFVLFLITLFSPAINELSDYYIFPNKKIVKYIRKEVSKSDIDSKILRRYRIVFVKELNVRENNSKTSKLIGKIYFGQIVRVVEKNKNWSFIEWENSDEKSNVTIRGWVFNRYLKRF